MSNFAVTQKEMMTVEDLIHALQQMPYDTLVKTAHSQTVSGMLILSDYCVNHVELWEGDAVYLSEG